MHARFAKGRLIISVPIDVETVRTGEPPRLRVDEESLTRRESQVLNGVRRRLSNKELAGELHVSESTVKKFVSRLLDRYGCDSRAELVFKFGHAEDVR